MVINRTNGMQIAHPLTCENVRILVNYNEQYNDEVTENIEIVDLKTLGGESILTSFTEDDLTELSDYISHLLNGTGD